MAPRLVLHMHDGCHSSLSINSDDRAGFAVPMVGGQQPSYSLQAPGTRSGCPARARWKPTAAMRSAVARCRARRSSPEVALKHGRLRATLPGMHARTAGRTRRSSVARASSVSRSPGSFAPSASSSPDICQPAHHASQLLVHLYAREPAHAAGSKAACTSSGRVCWSIATSSQCICATSAGPPCLRGRRAGRAMLMRRQGGVKSICTGGASAPAAWYSMR